MLGAPVTRPASPLHSSAESKSPSFLPASHPPCLESWRRRRSSSPVHSRDHFLCSPESSASSFPHQQTASFTSLKQPCTSQFLVSSQEYPIPSSPLLCCYVSDPSPVLPMSSPPLSPRSRGASVPSSPLASSDSPLTTLSSGYSSLAGSVPLSPVSGRRLSEAEGIARSSVQPVGRPTAGASCSPARSFSRHTSPSCLFPVPQIVVPDRRTIVPLASRSPVSCLPSLASLPVVSPSDWLCDSPAPSSLLSPTPSRATVNIADSSSQKSPRHRLPSSVPSERDFFVTRGRCAALSLRPSGRLVSAVSSPSRASRLSRRSVGHLTPSQSSFRKSRRLSFRSMASAQQPSALLRGRGDSFGLGGEGRERVLQVRPAVNGRAGGVASVPLPSAAAFQRRPFALRLSPSSSVSRGVSPASLSSSSASSPSSVSGASSYYARDSSSSGGQTHLDVAPEYQAFGNRLVRDQYMGELCRGVSAPSAASSPTSAWSFPAESDARTTLVSSGNVREKATKTPSYTGGEECPVFLSGEHEGELRHRRGKGPVPRESLRERFADAKKRLEDETSQVDRRQSLPVPSPCASAEVANPGDIPEEFSSLSITPSRSEVLATSEPFASSSACFLPSFVLPGASSPFPEATLAVEDESGEREGLLEEDGERGLVGWRRFMRYLVAMHAGRKAKRKSYGEGEQTAVLSVEAVGEPDSLALTGDVAEKRDGSTTGLPFGADTGIPKAGPSFPGDQRSTSCQQPGPFFSAFSFSGGIFTAFPRRLSGRCFFYVLLTLLLLLLSIVLLFGTLQHTQKIYRLRPRQTAELQRRTLQRLLVELSGCDSELRRGTNGNVVVFSDFQPPTSGDRQLESNPPLRSPQACISLASLSCVCNLMRSLEPPVRTPGNQRQTQRELGEGAQLLKKKEAQDSSADISAGAVAGWLVSRLLHPCPECCQGESDADGTSLFACKEDEASCLLRANSPSQSCCQWPDSSSSFVSPACRASSASALLSDIRTSCPLRSARVSLDLLSEWCLDTRVYEAHPADHQGSGGFCSGDSSSLSCAAGNNEGTSERVRCCPFSSVSPSSADVSTEILQAETPSCLPYPSFNFFSPSPFPRNILLFFYHEYGMPTSFLDPDRPLLVCTEADDPVYRLLVAMSPLSWLRQLLSSTLSFFSSTFSGKVERAVAVNTRDDQDSLKPGLRESHSKRRTSIAAPRANSPPGRFTDVSFTELTQRCMPDNSSTSGAHLLPDCKWLNFEAVLLSLLASFPSAARSSHSSPFSAPASSFDSSVPSLAPSSHLSLPSNPQNLAAGTSTKRAAAYTDALRVAYGGLLPHYFLRSLDRHIGRGVHEEGGEEASSLLSTASSSPPHDSSEQVSDPLALSDPSDGSSVSRLLHPSLVSSGPQPSSCFSSSTRNSSTSLASLLPPSSLVFDFSVFSTPCYPFSRFLHRRLLGWGGLQMHLILFAGWTHSFFASEPLILLHVPRALFLALISAYRGAILYEAVNWIESWFWAKAAGPACPEYPQSTRGECKVGVHGDSAGSGRIREQARGQCARAEGGGGTTAGEGGGGCRKGYAVGMKQEGRSTTGRDQSGQGGAVAGHTGGHDHTSPQQAEGAGDEEESREEEKSESDRGGACWWRRRDFSDHVVLYIMAILFMAVEVSAARSSHFPPSFTSGVCTPRGEEMTEHNLLCSTPWGFLRSLSFILWPSPGLVYAVVFCYYGFLIACCLHMAYYTALFFHSPEEVWIGFVGGVVFLVLPVVLLVEVLERPSLQRIGIGSGEKKAAERAAALATAGLEGSPERPADDDTPQAFSIRAGGAADEEEKPFEKIGTAASEISEGVGEADGLVEMKSWDVRTPEGVTPRESVVTAFMRHVIDSFPRRRRMSGVLETNSVVMDGEASEQGDEEEEEKPKKA